MRILYVNSIQRLSGSYRNFDSTSLFFIYLQVANNMAKTRVKKRFNRKMDPASNGVKSNVLSKPLSQRVLVINV